MSDYFMDFSNDDLDKGKELQAVPEGEYRVRIKDWKTTEDGKFVRTTEDGRPYIMPVLEIIGCPEAEYAKDFTHFMWMLDSDMDAKQKNNARYKLNEFWSAFGIDTRQPIDPEQTLGAEADVLLTVQEDQGYGEQNRVKRFMPRR